MLELVRYIVLTPVRAKMVAEAGDWPWTSTSDRATAGLSKVPERLTTAAILDGKGDHRVRCESLIR
jgi:putative transposase